MQPRSTLRSQFVSLVVALISIASALNSASAQDSTTKGNRSVGLLVVAHGADTAWNNRVRKTVAQTKWIGGPVKLAFLMGPEAETTGWEAAVKAMQHDAVRALIVVPLMVSSHGGHFRQVRYYAGDVKEIPPDMIDMGHDMAPPLRPTVPTLVSPALDDAPELGQALAARWHELSAADRKRPVMLIAHGPNAQDEVALWEKNIMTTAKTLRAEVAPQPVRVALLRDDAPVAVRATSVAAMRDTIESLARVAKDSVTVMTVLISTGDINSTKIPKDISGLPVRYSGQGLAPQPALAKWIARMADSLSTVMHRQSTNR